jgi:hypothetical protein
MRVDFANAMRAPGHFITDTNQGEEKYLLVHIKNTGQYIRKFYLPDFSISTTFLALSLFGSSSSDLS